MQFTLYPSDPSRQDTAWYLENEKYTIYLCGGGLRRIFGNILSRKDTYNVWIKPSKSGVLQYENHMGMVRIQREDGSWTSYVITCSEFDRMMQDLCGLHRSDKESCRFNVWYQKIEPSV